MASSVTSFAYFTHFQTEISLDLMEIFANDEQHLLIPFSLSGA